MIARFILLILLSFLVYTVFIALLRWLRGNSADEVKKIEPDQMVQCAYCGIYVPQMDAIRKKKRGEAYYLCDEKCLEAYKNKQ